MIGMLLVQMLCLHKYVAGRGSPGVNVNYTCSCHQSECPIANAQFGAHVAVVH